MAPIVDTGFVEISKMDSKVLNTNGSVVDGIDKALYLDGKRICLDCFDTKNVVKENNNVHFDVNKNEVENKSYIQEFYNGKNVFITGGTGFLGKLIIEKLLRSCPGVENLYLLVRPKRGKDIYTRVDEIFNDPVFEPLKTSAPKIRHKVVAIAGDCNAPGLGLSLTDRQMLAEKVNIILHSAATVKFDEPLRAALVTNVQAPLHLLRLARDMRNFDVLMQVSTAYSNCHQPLIEEKFYPCGGDLDKLQCKIDKMTDAEIDAELPNIIGPWPNTYTFTKALSERELREQRGCVPVGIFRPSIIISTANEPIKSWIDNMYGPTGIAVGCVTGVLRTMRCDGSAVADIVPADFVVNSLLAAARQTYIEYKSSTPPSEPPIFNYVSSVENKITWQEFTEHNTAHIDKAPLSTAIWYFSLLMTRHAWLYTLLSLALHVAPAAALDLLALCVARPPRMLKVYGKIHKFAAVISYFSSREFKFSNNRTRQLWSDTAPLDQKLFPFSISSLNWKDYFESYLLGIRRYIFKEPDSTIPQAAVKWRRLYYLHQMTRCLFLALAMYGLWVAFVKLF